MTDIPPALSQVSASFAGAQDDVNDCADRARAALRQIDGRWKLQILSHLHGAGMMRFSQLQRSIAGISHKMLTQHLRALEEDSLVARVVYPQVPPRVEYRLTEKGLALEPVFAALTDLGRAS